MEIELIEKPSAALAVFSRAALYAGVFVAVCALWIVIDVTVFGRFDPKFGRFGSVAAQLAMSATAMAGALLIFLIFRDRGASATADIGQAAAAALIVLAVWKIDRAYLVVDHFLSLFGSGGNLVVLMLLVGAAASVVARLVVAAVIAAR